MFHSNDFALVRTHLVRLATGADLVGALTEYASQRNIAGASLTFLGAVERASLRYYDQTGKEYRDYAIDQRMEVVSGTGNISLLDQRPFVHVHAAFSDEAGRAFGGHINRGTIVFALEATLFELDGAPVREPDDCTGLPLWGGSMPRVE